MVLDEVTRKPLESFSRSNKKGKTKQTASNAVIIDMSQS